MSGIAMTGMIGKMKFYGSRGDLACASGSLDGDENGDGHDLTDHINGGCIRDIG